MIPLILKAKTTVLQDNFIKDLIKKDGYLPYYIFKVLPIKTEISIQQIRIVTKELIADIPANRLFIIYNFETASLEAQNAFLKTLEERNEKNHFVLVVNSMERILPTIKSRCKILSLDSDNELTPVNDSVEKMLNTIQTNDDYSFFAPVTGITREDAIKLFDHIIVILREKLKTGEKKTPMLLKKLLQQKGLLLNNNLNPQLAVDSYLIFYKKQIK